MPTEHFLNNLIINKVDTAETYEAMRANNLVNEEEIYLIENPVADYIKEVNKGAAQKFWRGTKEEFDAITEKSDDTMYIVTDENGGTVVDQVNADWNENNSKSRAYIKNRTHWTDITKIIVYRDWGGGAYTENLENVTLTFEDGYNDASTLLSGNAYINPNCFLELGRTYYVVWDGVEYECVCTRMVDEWDEETLYIGTQDGACPFYVCYNSTGTAVLSYINGERETGTTTHILSLYELSEIIQKLDSKYLPDDIGVQSDWNENDENSAAYVKNRPGGYTTFTKEARIMGEGSDAITLENITATSYDGVIEIHSILGDWVENPECIINPWDGQSYYVVWDGVEYECVSYAVNHTEDPIDDTYAVGATDGSYPFYITCGPFGQSWDVLTYANGVQETGEVSHTLSIYNKREKTVPFDAKYLPDTVATKADIEAAIGAAISASY